MDPILIDIPEEFATERLIVRCPRRGEGAAINAAVIESLAELKPWMPWAQRAPTIDESEANSRQAHANFLTRSDLTMRLVRKSDGLIVGSTGLHPRGWDIPSFEIGYWCRTSCTGQGYVTEAVIGLSRFAERHLRPARLYLRCDAENVKSQRVAERSGFILEGVARDDCRTSDGRLRSSHTFVRPRPATPG